MRNFLLCAIVLFAGCGGTSGLPPLLNANPSDSSRIIDGCSGAIFICSSPAVAEIFLNGNLIGRTNVAELKLPCGTLNLQFRKKDKVVNKFVPIQAGKNPSLFITL
jgi:hypothetical protein